MGRLNFLNNKPRKVVCVKNKDEGLFVCEENSPLLTVGDTYTLVNIEDCSPYIFSLVWLEEFPGKMFISTCFEEIE